MVWENLAVGRHGMGQVGCGTTWYGIGWQLDDVVWDRLAVGRGDMG